VRSLNPERGMARRRGSQETLLARGIAAPRKASGRLPVLAGTRRLITPSPSSIRLARLGQDRVRGKWLILCVLFLASAVVYGAVVGGQTARAYDALTGGIEHLAVSAGFGVKRITLTGQLHATDAAITAALGAGPDTMMLGFDTDAAKARQIALFRQTQAKEKTLGGKGSRLTLESLQQQIAQLLLECAHVAPLDGVGDLVGFLDGVGGDGLEILLQVPRAARPRRPERRHHGQKIGNGLARLFAHRGFSMPVVTIRAV